RERLPRLWAGGGRGVPRRIRNEGGESAHHGELLVSIEGARVREDLDANVVAFSVDVGQPRRGELVHERGRVLPEHRDVRYLLDRHELASEVLGQGMGIAERAGGSVDVDHRHGVRVPFRSEQLPGAVDVGSRDDLQDEVSSDIRILDERTPGIDACSSRAPRRRALPESAVGTLYEMRLARWGAHF